MSPRSSSTRRRRCGRPCSPSCAPPPTEAPPTRGRPSSRPTGRAAPPRSPIARSSELRQSHEHESGLIRAAGGRKAACTLPGRTQACLPCAAVRCVGVLRLGLVTCWPRARRRGHGAFPFAFQNAFSCLSVYKSVNDIRHAERVLRVGREARPRQTKLCRSKPSSEKLHAPNPPAPSPVL